MDSITLAYILGAFCAGYVLGILVAEPYRKSYRRSLSAWIRMKYNRWGL